MSSRLDQDMKCLEFIRVYVDPGDLDELNALGSVGWSPVAFFPGGNYLLLARHVPEERVADVRAYYEKRGTTPPKQGDSWNRKTD